MPRDNFLQRKEAVLSKLDKSSIGGWDKPIQGLCDKVNKSSEFYTTSSCSGRVLIMIEQEKKAKGLFLETSHDLISFDWIKKALIKIEKSGNKELIKFKNSWGENWGAKGYGFLPYKYIESIVDCWTAVDFLETK